MDPKEFNWTAEQQVVVSNPTGKDFRFQVHSKWYEVPSAKTVKMPGFIAWSYVYKLAVKMALDDGNFEKWNEDGVHQEYYDKVVVSVEEVIQQVAVVDETVTTFDTDDLDDDPLGNEGTGNKPGGKDGASGKPEIKPMEHKHGLSGNN